MGPENSIPNKVLSNAYTAGQSQHLRTIAVQRGNKMILDDS